jgi:hypothetical protein
VATQTRNYSGAELTGAIRSATAFAMFRNVRPRLRSLLIFVPLWRDVYQQRWLML